MKEDELFKKVHGVSCHLNNVDYDKSLTKWRKREAVVARQMTMCAYKDYTKKSLSNIGILFNQHHATVLSGIKTVNNLCDTDYEFKEKYDSFIKETSRFFRGYKSSGLKPKSIGQELKEALKGYNLVHVRINIRHVISKYKL